MEKMMPWAKAAPWLRKGWKIAEMKMVGGEWWVALQKAPRGSTIVSKARKGQKGS
jgi:hypothetical protein